MARTINLSIAIGVIFATFAIAQEASIKIPQDSINFAGYKAIYYRYSLPDSNSQFEWDIYNCDRLILASTIHPQEIEFYDFCQNSAGPHITCNYEDINSDGDGEIIFEVQSGNNDGRIAAYIYSIDSLATKIAVFDGREKGFGKLSFRDIDNDGNREILLRDLNFHCWHSHCADAPEPYLVWKLFGQQYKLANLTLNVPLINNLYNFKTPIIGGPSSWAASGYGPPVIDSLADALGKVKYYNPNNDATYPINLARMIIILSFTNYTESPKNLLDAAWPDSVPNKDTFWTELQNKIKSDPLWKDVRESGPSDY